ncbi:hypothetical protein [Crassaminicella indica]|uniref:Uncharacterized protein n=1 Tax=Crassaminicella indica TaxID=2855394 RepID=A0ABX8RAM9_9CLOT|nr:hypothetical protein [Crassaminicella indica]QXM05492.1 hypothetical protein KVH43_08875 [Crassaminicella indica]
MNFFKYLLLCIISPFIITFFSFRFGYIIGPGDDGSGITIAAISLLNTTIIVGFFILFDILKNKNI